jgi:large subunit ribosomal protein L15
VIDEIAVVDAGLIKKPLDGIKLLGGGEVSKAFTVKLTAVSASAKQKIIGAGGTVEVAENNVEVAN